MKTIRTNEEKPRKKHKKMKKKKNQEAPKGCPTPIFQMFHLENQNNQLLLLRFMKTAEDRK